MEIKINAKLVKLDANLINQLFANGFLDSKLNTHYNVCFESADGNFIVSDTITNEQFLLDEIKIICNDVKVTKEDILNMEPLIFRYEPKPNEQATYVQCTRHFIIENHNGCFMKNNMLPAYDLFISYDNRFFISLNSEGQSVLELDNDAINFLKELLKFNIVSKGSIYGIQKN